MFYLVMLFTRWLQKHEWSLTGERAERSSYNSLRHKSDWCWKWDFPETPKRCIAERAVLPYSKCRLINSQVEADKKAELLQRWTRDAPCIWCPENFPEFLSTPMATFAEIFNGLLFRSILWMFGQNLKFVALPIPEIIMGNQKIWAVLGYTHALFPKFLMGFCSDVPCECTWQIWSS